MRNDDAEAIAVIAVLASIMVIIIHLVLLSNISKHNKDQVRLLKLLVNKLVHGKDPKTVIVDLRTLNIAYNNGEVTKEEYLELLKTYS